jgi:UDP:flavonoid glycosyltransferase YjiC (YdhE family)
MVAGVSGVLFVSPPFEGHLNPLLVLEGAARGAGYETRVFRGGRFVAELLAVANWPKSTTGNPLRKVEQLRETLRMLGALQSELREIVREMKPEVIVADSVAIVAGPVAREYGVPWMTTIATPFSIENRRGVPAYCGGWKSGWALRDAAGRAAVKWFKDGVAWWFAREFRELGLARRLRPDGTEAIYSGQALLGFGIGEMEFDRDWPAAFEMIGPVVGRGRPVEPLALGAGRQVLVTLGTHLGWAKGEMVRAVVGMATAMPEVEFTVTLGGGEGEMGQVARNVLVVRYVDYREHLGRFDAIVHHGGAGVVNACVLAGKPSVVVPLDYDQFDYAARVEWFGLGKRAQGMTDVRRLLPAVLGGTWPRLREMQRSAQAYQPERRFLERLSQTILPAGTNQPKSDPHQR